ncbi:MAG: hypothetical protein ACT4TC_11470 [Myxococcaceae bacterium]
MDTHYINQEVVMELVCSSISPETMNQRSPGASTFDWLLAPPILLPLAILLSPLVHDGVIVLVATDAHRSLYDEE